MADIFLSYSRTDKPLAAPLVAALEAKGWSVWWDMDLAPGSDFDAVTSDALKTARAVVVLWTPISVASRWVRGEARVGADRGVLIPVRFENAELPIDVLAIHTTDLDGWDGDTQGAAFRKLEQSLTALLDGTDVVAAPSIGAPPPLPEKPSIAVLPFTDLSPAKDQDYFCDGMVVEIVTALSRFRTLFVIASGSSLTYRDVAGRLPQIARELGVRYLLEGSVRKAGDRVRIAAHLIDAHDGAREVWAERFDGTLEDVFALQDKVAGAVASKIEPTILAIETRRASARPTADVTAYDLFLRGMKAVGCFTKAGHAEALTLFGEAIARDPNYAEALSIAAFAHTNRIVLGWSDDLEGDRRLALDLRSRALSARSDDPEVISTVAMASMQLGVDAAGALAAAERALSRHPGSSTVQMNTGFVFVYAGQAAAALAGFEASLRLDPLSTWRQIVLFGMAFANLFLKRFEAVVPLAREAGELLPDLRG